MKHVSEQAKRRNEFFDHLLEYLAAELVKHGIDEQKAIESAENVALGLFDHWKSATFVFPAKPRLVMERTKQAVLSEYDGRDILSITRKYGISENTFYRWLREERMLLKKKLDEQQGQLDL